VGDKLVAIFGSDMDKPVYLHGDSSMSHVTHMKESCDTYE